MWKKLRSENEHVDFVLLKSSHLLLFADLLSRIDLDELMKKDEPPFTFPKTLEEFEYAFNECEHIHLLFKAKAKSVTMSFMVCPDTQSLLPYQKTPNPMMSKDYAPFQMNYAIF